MVDWKCALVAHTDLEPLRSIPSDVGEVPCWAWDIGALTEETLGRVSLYTLVWETRMTGYVVLLLFSEQGRIVCGLRSHLAFRECGSL